MPAVPSTVIPSSLIRSPLLSLSRPLRVLSVAALTVLAACQAPTHVSATDRRAIADSLSALVVEAYDFSQPGAAERLLSLYPDSGRVISAAAGQVTTTRDTLEGAIRGFWQRVGQNMQQPRFVLGSTYVDVLTRDAAVMTLTYSIPHRTPRDTPHVVSGAWTMLWRRQGGRWQIVQEHLSDTPESTAPGPPPAATDSTDGSHTDQQH
jgi:ketosteroid isomerase-like protein